MSAAALIVGCPHFDRDTITPLKYSGDDAERMASFLKRYGSVADDALILMKSADIGHSTPTRANVLSSVLRIASPPGGRRFKRIYLFLSGHGVVSRSNGHLYFICRDTVPELLQETALDIDFAINKLRMGSASEIIVFLDTCRSIFVEDAKDTGTTNFQPFSSNDRFASVIYSCEPGAASYESDIARAGVFTEALLAELGDGGICATMGELRERLPQTMAQISGLAKKPLQVPFFAVEEASGAEISLVDELTSYARRRTRLFTNEKRPTSIPGNVPRDLQTKIFAIDFGTSKTLAAFPLYNGGIYYVPSPSGSPLLESTITLTKDFSYTVGRRTEALSDGDLRLRDSKRVLGKEVLFTHLGLHLTVTDTVTLLLNSVRRNIEDKLGKTYPNIRPRDVVVSYPVNFSRRQIEQFKRALAYAGFKCIRAVSEAAAAAIALQTHYPDALIEALVVDLGGGTLDVAIAECGDGVIEIKAVDGDKNLGGRDFDEVVQIMLNDAIRELDTDSGTVAPPAIDEFSPLIEQAKFRLNTEDDVTVFLGESEGAQGEIIACTTTLTYAEFVRRCEPLIIRFKAAISRAIARSPFPDGGRAVVMLAGQGTRLRLVRAAIDQMFADVEIFDKLQENAVATGLAHQAGVLGGTRKDILLLDVYHLRLGFYQSGTVSTDIEILDAGRPTGQMEKAHVIGDSNPDFAETVRRWEHDETVPTRRDLYLTFTGGKDTVALIERGVSDEDECELATLRFKNPLTTQWWHVVIDIDANTTILLYVAPARTPSLGWETPEFRLRLLPGYDEQQTTEHVELCPTKEFSAWLQRY